MGLAASQARLLFVTMRQNDVSAKMQRISNDKMILARDEDDIATKYNQMINQKDYKLKDGVSLSYDALMGSGALNSGEINFISVGAGGIDGHPEYKNRIVLNSTISEALGLDKTGTGEDFKSLYPTPADLKAKLEPKLNPSVNGAGDVDDTDSVNGTIGSSATLTADKENWAERIEKLDKTYGEYPTAQSEPISINSIVAKMDKMPVTTSDIHDGSDDGISWKSTKQNNNVFNADYQAGDERRGNTSIWKINQMSFIDLINPKDGNDITMIIADDGDHKGVPNEQAKSNFIFMTNKILGSMAKVLDVPTSALQSLTKDYTNAVCKNIDDKNYQTPRDDSSDKRYSKARDKCLNGNLISGCYDGDGTHRDGFVLNVSELCRELIAMVIDEYLNSNSTKGGLSSDSFGNLKNTAKVSLNTNIEHTLIYNSKGYSEDAYQAIVAEEFKKAGYKALNWPEALKFFKENITTESSDESKTDKTTASNEVNIPNNIGQVTVGEYYQALWSKLAQFGWYVDSKLDDLQSKLENGQYYLNGTIAKNNEDFYAEEKEVSAEQTAKAEAFWKVEMQKINRKEKKLDLDMANLQTEYSSLTNDMESVKNIISQNVSRSFTFCQNG